MNRNIYFPIGSFSPFSFLRGSIFSSDRTWTFDPIDFHFIKSLGFKKLISLKNECYALILDICGEECRKFFSPICPQPPLVIFNILCYRYHTKSHSEMSKKIPLLYFSRKYSNKLKEIFGLPPETCDILFNICGIPAFLTKEDLNSLEDNYPFYKANDFNFPDDFDNVFFYGPIPILFDE